MSGHSKWSSIKHKKAKKDAQKGAIFSKLSRKIAIEARAGGDPETNPALRLAIDMAQEVGMPKDNIQRAIQRGTGEMPGVSYVAFNCEGYGPGGVALFIEGVTDNKKRAIAEIRHILSKNGGHLGEVGCVNWLFDRKGLMVLHKTKVDDDKVIEMAIEVGAEDIKDEGDILEIIFAPEQFSQIKENIERIGYSPELFELTMIPQTTVPLEEKEALRMLRLMDALEDSEEVQKVYANFDITEEIMEKVS
ncbi:YebC/PmpR family DNA-binding transcriptional regulator [Candidatus Aerophobetes bacterium Ae_b3a]|nr:MAG: YebC/PmpR family DNA-binding transcriptional regulator [Candidatus Aerophobetes bacterium Ae_b3a]